MKSDSNIHYYIGIKNKQSLNMQVSLRMYLFIRCKIYMYL